MFHQKDCNNCCSLFLRNLPHGFCVNGDSHKANFFYGERCSFIGWERIDFQYQTSHFFTVCTDGTSAFASYIPVHPTQQKKRYYSREPIEAITAMQA